MTQTRSGKQYSGNSQGMTNTGNSSPTSSTSQSSETRLRRRILEASTSTEGKAAAHERQRGASPQEGSGNNHADSILKASSSSSPSVVKADDQQPTIHVSSPRPQNTPAASTEPGLRSSGSSTTKRTGQASPQAQGPVKFPAKYPAQRRTVAVAPAKPPQKPTPSASTQHRSSSGGYLHLLVAVGALLLAMVLMYILRGRGPATEPIKQQQKQFHHHSLVRTVSGIIHSTEDEQLQTLQDQLQGEDGNAGAKAVGIVVSCSSSHHCEQVTRSIHSGVDGGCALHVDSSTYSDVYGGARGYLQSVLVNFMSKCSYGVVTFDEVLTTGINNVHTLIHAMSEGGGLTYDGKLKSTAELSFVFIERMDVAQPLETASDIMAAKKVLRQKVLSSYGDLLSEPSGVQVKVTLEALMRRLEYFFPAQ